MQVFKAYFKIIKKNLLFMLIYVFIFILLTVTLSFNNTNNNSGGFSQTKDKIAFISYDGDSQLISGFKDYLSQNATIVDIPDNNEKLQDALFFSKIVYIVRVPKGFTQNFLNGNDDLKISKTTIPASASAFYLDSLINKYFNTAKLYTRNINGITQPQLVAYINDNLSMKTNIESTNNSAYFFCISHML